MGCTTVNVIEIVDVDSIFSEKVLDESPKSRGSIVVFYNENVERIDRYIDDNMAILQAISISLDSKNISERKVQKALENKNLKKNS